jgi:hypothetical protein
MLLHESHVDIIFLVSCHFIPLHNLGAMVEVGVDNDGCHSCKGDAIAERKSG